MVRDTEIATYMSYCQSGIESTLEIQGSQKFVLVYALKFVAVLAEQEPKF